MNKYLEKIAEFDEVPVGEYVAGGLVGTGLGAAGGVGAAEFKNRKIPVVLSYLKRKEIDQNRKAVAAYNRLEWANRDKLEAMSKAEALRNSGTTVNLDLMSVQDAMDSLAGKLTPEEVQKRFGGRIAHYEKLGKGALSEPDFAKKYDEKLTRIGEKIKSIYQKKRSMVEARRVGTGKRALIGAGVGAATGLGAAWLAHQ